jgi:hypothetical protein
VPVIDRLRVSTRYVEIDYTWRVGAGRLVALAALLRRLVGDLGTALAPAGDVAAALRPFLVVRVLGVIPLRQLSGPHAVTCLAKIAELSGPALTLPGWCAAVPAAPPAAAVTGCCGPAAPSATVAENLSEEHHDRPSPRPADHTKQ